MKHKDVVIYFYFIRHGESEGNLRPDLIGGRSPSVHLSERGIAQAKALGIRFLDEGVHFDQFFVSSLSRAVETANEIFSAMGKPVDEIKLVNEIIEFSQGEWEGKPRNKIYTIENLSYINSKGFLFIPPNGESQRMVQRRVTEWLEDKILYNDEFLGKTMPLHIGIVAHGIVLKTLFHYILRFDDRFIWRFKLDNCSISKFLFKKEGWFPLCINDSGHLHQIGKLPGLHTEK